MSIVMEQPPASLADLVAAVREKQKAIEEHKRAIDAIEREIAAMTAGFEEAGAGRRARGKGARRPVRGRSKRNECVEIAREVGGPITAKMVAARLGVDLTAAAMRLSRAKRAGLLNQIGHGQYVLPDAPADEEDGFMAPPAPDFEGPIGADEDVPF